MRHVHALLCIERCLLTLPCLPLFRFTPQKNITNIYASWAPKMIYSYITKALEGSYDYPNPLKLKSYPSAS